MAIRTREEYKSLLGTSVPRVDSISKVTGAAKYSFDISFPNMLFGKILRSPYPPMPGSGTLM